MLTWEMTIRLRECGTWAVYASIQLSVHRLSRAGTEDEVAAMRLAGFERSPDVPNLYVRDATTPAEIHSTLQALVEWLRGSGSELAVTWDLGAPQGEVRWPAVLDSQ